MLSGLIIEPEQPKRHNVQVAEFNIVFDHISVCQTLYLLFPLVATAHLKGLLLHQEVGHGRGNHIVVHSHLVQEECFPEIPDVRLSCLYSISEKYLFCSIVEHFLRFNLPSRWFPPANWRKRYEDNLAGFAGVYYRKILFLFGCLGKMNYICLDCLIDVVFKDVTEYGKG